MPNVTTDTQSLAQRTTAARRPWWPAALAGWILTADALYVILYWPDFLNLFCSLNRSWLHW